MNIMPHFTFKRAFTSYEMCISQYLHKSALTHFRRGIPMPSLSPFTAFVSVPLRVTGLWSETREIV